MRTLKILLKKMIQLFNKFIDWIGKNIGRIKTIGLLTIIILMIISFVNNGCNRHELSKIVEKVTGLNIQNDILHKNIKERDSLLLLKDVKIAEIKDSLQKSQKKTKELEMQYKHLENDYRNLSSKLISITTDSSYSFLIHIAYPYEGNMKYPFNEPQVKGIHLTWLEKISLEELNNNLLAQVDGCKAQLVLKDNLITETSGEMSLMKETRKDLEKIIDNKDIIIQTKDKEINRNNRRKNFWKVTTGIAGGLFIIALF